MTADHTSTHADEVWAWVDGERRADLRLRRISFTAWVTMFVAVLVYCSSAALRLSIAVRATVRDGASLFDASTLYVLADQIVPVVVAIGAFSALVAAFSTVGVFLRLRTASLGEIQMRLATLEHLLSTEDPTRPEPTDAS